jgi:hypothetical protein
MASDINFTDIDETYPKSGIDNSTQGFRDNFSLIKTNFQTSKEEIEFLQENAIIANVNNNLRNGTLANVAFKTSFDVAYNITTVEGTATYNINLANYQSLELDQNITLQISGVNNYSDRVETIKLRVIVTNPTYTLTWPSEVSVNLFRVPNTEGQITKFADTGEYEFEISTLDNGTSWIIKDLTRSTSYLDGNLVIINTHANGTPAIAVNITTLDANGNVYSTIRANSVITDALTVITSNSVVLSNASLPGNITANNVTANTGIYGVLKTSSQPNVTTVGNLTNLTVLGTTTMTNMADVCGTFVVGLYTGNITSGQTVDTNSANVPQYIINPNESTIAAATIIMPSIANSPAGRRISFSFANTITTLTMSASANTTIQGGLTTASNTTPAAFVFSSGVWYRTA